MKPPALWVAWDFVTMGFGAGLALSHFGDGSQVVFGTLHIIALSVNLRWELTAGRVGAFPGVAPFSPVVAAPGFPPDDAPSQRFAVELSELSAPVGSPTHCDPCKSELVAVEQFATPGAPPSRRCVNCHPIDSDLEQLVER